MNYNFRVKQMEELGIFIQEKQNLLNVVLNQLDWKEESLRETKVLCPFNPGHWIPKSSLSQHMETCKWVHEGYVKEELKKQPPDSSFFYEKTSTVIPVLIDSAKQQSILSEYGLNNEGSTDALEIPKTIDRWTVKLKPDQRLAVYDYVVKTSKTADKPKNVTLEDLMVNFEKTEEEQDKPKSQLEIMAEIRDYKRRRQSYRAKNVHITKKSYTEIMKEVIENQTSYLTEVKKTESSENEMKEHESTGDFQESGHYSESFEKNRDHSDRHREYSRSRKRHYSRSRSRSYSPRHKHRHKRDRSRSRSKTHKHKKSHHKHRRSRD